MRNSVLVLGLAMGLVGCAHKGAASAGSAGAARASQAPAHDIDAGRSGGGRASSDLAPKSGNSTLAGHAAFSETGEGITLVLHGTGARPGEHGAHIHETGDCSDAEAKAAGGHWNPEGHKHGAPPPSSAHLGDLG